MKKLSLTLLTVALLASPVANAAPTAAPSAKEVSELFKVLEEQRKQLDAQKKQMEAQQRKLDQLQKQITEISRQKSTTKTASDETSTTQQPPDAFARSETPTEVGTERKPEESESPPEIAADLDAGGVLLKKGQLVLTPAVEYTRSSSTLVAVEGWNTLQVLNIGTFQISRVGRDVITGSVAARVGITNRFELEGKVPYIYRRDSTTGRPVGSSGTDNTTRATGMALATLSSARITRSIRARAAGLSSSPISAPKAPPAKARLKSRLMATACWYACRPAPGFMASSQASPPFIHPTPSFITAILAIPIISPVILAVRWAGLSRGTASAPPSV